MSYEEVGLRLRTDGAVEAGNGVNLLADALDKLSAGAGAALGPLEEASSAARAMAGGMSATTLAVSAAVAGVASAVAAYVQITAEQNAFHRSIIMTGNAAGVTAGMLQDMAAQASQAAGTQAQASEVLAALTATAQVSRAQLLRSAEAAIAMERSLGIEAAETVKIFASLGGDPVRAAAKLNETHNFLTLEVWRQIKALQDRGRVEEAASLAQETYADAAIKRAKQMEEQLGSLQKAWRWVGEVSKGAWDAMLGLGRGSTTGSELARLQDQIQQLEGWIGSPTATERELAAWGAELDMLRDKQAALQELDRIQRRVADGQAAGAAAMRAQIDADTARGGRGARGARRDIPGAIDDSTEQVKHDFLRSEKRAYDDIAKSLAEVERRERARVALQEQSMRQFEAGLAQRTQRLKDEDEAARELAETLAAQRDADRKIEDERRDLQDAERRRQVIEESIYDGLANGFRDGEKPAQLFLRMLRNEFARNILRVPVQFIAAAQRSVIDDIIGSIGRWVGIGGGNGSAGDVAAADEVYQGAVTKSFGGGSSLKLAVPASGGALSKSRASTAITYAPVINVDSRTDRAEVVALVQRSVRAGQAELLDQLDRRQA
jgi:phage-related minor tail protein